MNGGEGLLTESDHARIAKAITAAEKGTSGEIYCVLARRSDDYFFPAAFMLALLVLVLTAVAALSLQRSWTPVRPVDLIAAQAAMLVAGLMALRLFPATRLWLVPGRLRRRRAHDNAMKQFLAHNVHRTTLRTGVLIFVSLVERHAEIVADAGIAAAVPQTEWDAIVADLVAGARVGRLADGFAGAVAATGALLAEHFPPIPGQAGELDDRLVEI